MNEKILKRCGLSGIVTPMWTCSPGYRESHMQVRDSEQSESGCTSSKG